MTNRRTRYKVGSNICLTLAALSFVGMLVASGFAARIQNGSDNMIPILGIVGSLIATMIFAAFGALQAIAVREYDKRNMVNAALPRPLPEIAAPSITEAFKAVTRPISEATKMFHVRAVCTEPGCTKCYREINESAFPEVENKTATNTIVVL